VAENSSFRERLREWLRVPSPENTQVFVLTDSGPQQCDLCGKVDELRPYGPNGEAVCFECGMKDEEAAGRAFDRRMDDFTGGFKKWSLKWFAEWTAAPRGGPDVLVREAMVAAYEEGYRVGLRAARDAATEYLREEVKAGRIAFR
jgi:hypothetical protein